MDGRSIVLVLLLSVAVVRPAGAALFDGYDARFDLQGDGRVAESLRLTLPNATLQETLIPLSAARASDLAVGNGTARLRTETSPDGGLRVLLPPGSTQLTLAFTADDLVFARGEESVFTTLLKPPAGVREVRVGVLLPEGLVLTREELSPPGAIRGSDGRRITLNWSLPAAESVAVVVPYGPPRTSSPPWALFGSAGVVAAAAGAALYYRARASAARFEGYSDDQQRAIALLREKGAMDQDDLREALKFSKAKCTRVVQAMEAKELLEKEKSGKTNKLKWKGG